MQAARCLSLGGILLALSCNARESSHAIPSEVGAGSPASSNPVDSSPSSASAEPSPSVQPREEAPAVSVTLAAEAVQGDKDSARVVIVATELGLREEVANVRLPYACEGFLPAPSEAWTVSCTPAFRRPLATVEVNGDTLVISSGPSLKNVRRLPLPRGADVRFSESTASARLLAGRACSDSPDGKPLAVKLWCVDYSPGYEPHTELALGLEGMASIMLDPTWDSRRSGDSQKCGTEPIDGGYRVKCPPGQNVGVGTVTADGAAVVIEWDNGSKLRGRALLPCGRQPRFEFAKRVSCSQRYF